MSVPCMLPKCGNAVSRPTTVVAFAKSPSGRFLALTHPKMVVVALPSQHHQHQHRHQGSWSRCVLERSGGRDSRLTASAAPCEERLESSSSSSSSIGNVGGFGGGGVAFESNFLQDLRADLVFEEGRSPNLIRAAAYLRALCFYTYPEGRSEEGLKLHRKMKADDEFGALSNKVAGLEQGYKRISCLLALFPISHFSKAAIDLHPALKVKLANGEEHFLVGSLDLNQGLRLAEEIIGNQPEVGSPFLARTPSLSPSAPSRATQGPDAERKRGYLSNVCVAPQVRQRGVGAALLLQAQKAAQRWGVSNLYVHVVASNEAAVKLYKKCGFIFEKEESASEARSLARPRRLLLHKPLRTPSTA